MHIDIHASGFDLTEGLRDHTRRKLAFALGHAPLANGRVRVSLSDINGPRGGLDKRCQIHIPLPHHGPVVVEDTESDLYAAIDRAVERAGETLRRRLARQRVRLRSSGRAAIADVAT